MLIQKKNHSPKKKHSYLTKDDCIKITKKNRTYLHKSTTTAVMATTTTDLICCFFFLKLIKLISMQNFLYSMILMTL